MWVKLCTVRGTAPPSFIKPYAKVLNVLMK